MGLHSACFINRPTHRFTNNCPLICKFDEKKERIKKIPSLYDRDEIREKLGEIEINGVLECVGLDAARNVDLGCKFVNPIINLPRSDTYEIVIDAKPLIEINDASQYLFPFLPVQVLKPKDNGTTVFKVPTVMRDKCKFSPIIHVFLQKLMEKIAVIYR